MDDIPEHSVIRTTAEYPYWYDATYGTLFFAKHTGKEFSMVPPSAIDAPRPDRAAVFVVRDAVAGRRFGSVVLWRVEQGHEAAIGRARTATVRAFVHRPELSRGGAGRPFLLVGEPEGTSGPRIALGSDELKPIRSGRDWGLYSVEVPTGGGAPISWRVAFDPDAISTLAGRADEGRANRR